MAELAIIRQNQPGKRIAIALILRAMSRAGIGKDDIVDLHGRRLRLRVLAWCARALPLFALDPELHALTTDEHVMVRGRGGCNPGSNMRFAQRRMAMQSHALSDRVLTLTGRCSVFRGTHIVRRSNSSGCRRPTSCTTGCGARSASCRATTRAPGTPCCKRGVKMTYVPDASGTTIEVVEGSGMRRMVENLRRWSGNMLRNGYRAILLGPRRMPFFIWWCCVDQRIAMWTMLLPRRCWRWRAPCALARSSCSPTPFTSR